MKFIIVKEEGTNNLEGRQTYVGVPYDTESEARAAAINDFYTTHFVYNHDHSMEVYYFENGTHLRFISNETGEIFCDYFLIVNFF